MKSMKQPLHRHHGRNTNRTEHHRSMIEINIDLASPARPRLRHTDRGRRAPSWPHQQKIGSCKWCDRVCVSCVSCRSTCLTPLTADRCFLRRLLTGKGTCQQGDMMAESRPIRCVCNQRLASGVWDKGRFIVNVYANASASVWLCIDLLESKLVLT